MIQVVNSYFLTAPSGSVGDYTNLSKSSDQSVTADAVITFDGVSSGNATLFSDANDTLIVPSGITLVRISTAYFQTNTSNGARKGGAAFNGQVAIKAQNQGRRSFATAPLAVITNDTFDYFAVGSSGTHAGQPWTWFGIELMDPATRYCVAKKSADQSLSAASTTTLAWDGTDIADTDSMHDTATNNTRITVPSGVTLARPFFNLVYSGTNGEFSAWVNKNGSTYNGRPVCDVESDIIATLCAYGAIIPVTGGTDYFEAVTFNASAATFKGGSQQSFFGVECFGSSYSYCTAYKSATQALSANVAATLLLESEVADTDNCHSTASSQGNFVCPSGKTRARLNFNVKGATTSGTNSLTAIAEKNSVQVQGLPHDARQSVNDEALNGMGNWIPVVSGDILRVRVTSTVAQTLPISGETWVCVEWA